MQFLPSRETGFKRTKLRESKFSVFWQPQNAISAESWTNVSRYLAKSVEVFSFLGPENAILTSREIYVRAFVPHIGELKNDFCRFIKPMFLGTLFWVWKFYSVWDPEIWFSPRCETNVIRLLKRGKYAHTILGTLEPWVSRLGKYRIF